MLEIVGKCSGKHVVSGVFNFFQTYGLPIDILVEELWNRGFVPSWECFYHEARDAGVTQRSVRMRIEEATSILVRLSKNSEKMLDNDFV